MAERGINTPQRTTRKRPGDFTGTQGQRLAAEHASELKEREKELAQVNAQQTVDLDTEIDLAPLVVKENKVPIRVNYPITDMTFGKKVFLPGDPNHPLGPGATDPYVGELEYYTFEEGQRYLVPPDVADHLDRLGYLWH